ncbi:MAG: insulinase family protein [Treponema sp.]|nr:insulinase family protein [Candidatus Treponema equifaecale]
MFRYTLENGLEIFVAENSAAPLAYIEIGVRAGAVTQTPETAGLFHLYEHMLFKGNAKYANQVEVTDAMSKMGEINRNGSTGLDLVNYYFTIPSSQVRNGLEFWSYAIRTPLLNEVELENEKNVVLSEINADFTNPGKIRRSGLNKVLFPAGPWRLDPGGDPNVVKNATPADLKKMQQLYYVPRNSAIFVGGDVHHEDVYKWVKEIYGDWKNPQGTVEFEPVPTKTPFNKLQKKIYVNPGSSDSMLQAGLYLRGPDGETDAEDTYAADVWSKLVQNPSEVFATTFVEEKSLFIPDSDYVAGSYVTARASGLIAIATAMMNQGELNPAEKVEKFYSVIQKKLVPIMQDKEKFFRPGILNSIKQQLEDSRVYQLETATSILSNLSSLWSSCGSDYFFGYDKNIGNVTEEDVVAFVNKYISGKNGVLLVTVSPGIWAKYGEEFKKNGFSEITSENAFWNK